MSSQSTVELCLYVRLCSALQDRWIYFTPCGRVADNLRTRSVEVAAIFDSQPLNVYKLVE